MPIQLNLVSTINFSLTEHIENGRRMFFKDLLKQVMMWLRL